MTEQTEQKQQAGSPFLAFATSYAIVAIVTLFLVGTGGTVAGIACILAAALCIVGPLFLFRGHSTPLVVSGTIVVTSLLLALPFILQAAHAGTSIAKAIVPDSATLTALMPQASGTADIAKTVDALTTVMSKLLPAVFFFQGLVVVLAGTWITARLSSFMKYDLDVLPAREIDLSPWVLLLLVVGIGGYAASYVIAKPALLMQVSLNLVFIAYLVLLVQGTALYDYLATRIKMPGAIQTVVYVIAMPLLFWVLPLFGLSDFWVNFRRLPREKHHADEERQDAGANGPGQDEPKQ